MTPSLTKKKHLTETWFKQLRGRICAEFEEIEAEFSPKSPGKFIKKPWVREGGGGGGNFFDEG